MHLLTDHGRLLCVDPGGALSQRPLVDAAAVPAALPATPPARGFERFLAGDDDTATVPLRSGPLAGLTAACAARTRTVMLHGGAYFLSAERDSRLITRTGTQA